MGLFGLTGGLLVFIVGVIFALVTIVLVLVLNLQKLVVIALTALGGGVAVIIAVLVMLNQVSLQALRESGNALGAIAGVSQLWTLLALVLAVIGIVWQIKANRSYEFSKEVYVQSWG
jgi:lipoprotein signal peptidase